MHVLEEYPEAVRKITFHEPPINTFLPQADHWQKQNEHIVELALMEELPKAMAYFGKALNISPIDAEQMAQPQSSDEATNQKRYEEMMNWVKYEIRQYTNSDIDLQLFKKYAEKIILLNGTNSKGSFPQEVNFYISEQTDIPILDIPGGHLGYFQKTRRICINHQKGMNSIKVSTQLYRFILAVTSCYFFIFIKFFYIYV